MKNMRFIAILVILLLPSLACSLSLGSQQVVQGSGVFSRQERDASNFTGIEIAGSADVLVSFGDTETVVVETDDNIQALIKTDVRDGKLVISTRPNTDITTRLGVRVTVTMKSLESASIRGSGTINISDLQADKVEFSLPGSGSILASGTADSVTATIGGSGEILCADLQAQSVDVDISGSGNITVYASESLDATILGSGTVQYRGNPPDVNQSIPGSGTIHAVP
jgi:hypothetical protein